MNTQPNKKSGSAPVAHSASETATPLNTISLFPKGSKERTIVHENTEYRLRITAQGKLILTK